MLALILVALAVGMSNFAGAIAIGLSGVDNRLRLRIAVAFGLFEGGMPLVGLLLGHAIAGSLGSNSKLIAMSLLVLTGAYTVIAAIRHNPDEPSSGGFHGSTPRLLATSLALSIDNLVIGFALGTYHVSLFLAVGLIAAISVTLSLIGLELGSRLGEHIGQESEIVGGVILIGVGVAIGTGLL